MAHALNRAKQAGAYGKSNKLPFILFSSPHCRFCSLKVSKPLAMCVPVYVHGREKENERIWGVDGQNKRKRLRIFTRSVYECLFEWCRFDSFSYLMFLHICCVCMCICIFAGD